MKIWITQDADGFYWLHLKDGKDGAGMLLETKSDICKRMLNRAKVTEEPPMDWKALALADRLGEALKEIASDWWAPTNRDGTCKECGRWTPARHPEAHDHKDDCRASKEEVRRNDRKGIARAALAEWRKARGGEKK